ncbi:hypothetical protein [uncultured Erythrobacter sp.]|uniref:hypothetical protein n=1 Tax=uncultured Erythrobacter sp. TaxID=263913 RepID=UPI002608F56E|nr:hypothetical protein [uncultured Erythrobacter sp.]
MEFAPLNYLWDSLTIWHLAIWIGFMITFEMAVRQKSKLRVSFARIFLTALLLAIIYGLFALLFGQLFGDKYTAAELWPSGMVLGGLLTSIGFFGDLFSEQRNGFPTWFAVLGIVIGANFCAFGLWLLPRIVGLGLIDFPRFSWGVQL